MTNQTLENKISLLTEDKLTLEQKKKKTEEETKNCFVFLVKILVLRFRPFLTHLIFKTIT